MAIRPGLLMRSREDQPCVQRCFGTSPPLFLRCCRFFSCFFSLIAHFERAGTRLPFAQQPHSFPFLHHHPTTSCPSCPDTFTVCCFFFCVLSSRSFIHAYSYVQSCLVLFAAQPEKQRNFFPPHHHSLYFPPSSPDNRKILRASQTVAGFADRCKRDARGQSQ